MFSMFAAPPDQSAAWSDTGVEGAFRFLRRLWAFAAKHAERIRGTRDAGGAASAAAMVLRRDVHLLLQRIEHDYDRLQYNSVVSGAMELRNALEAAALEPAPADDAVLAEGCAILLRVLYPVAPHIAHALWRELGYAATSGEVIDAPWPAVDAAALRRDEIELMLQVNGKLRGAIRVPAGADRSAIEAAALTNVDFLRFADGRTPKKVVVVPGRLVNVVV
jgi:leucyl-tRNA synthetase